MKKFAVIGVSLLLVLAVVAYVLLADRSADTEEMKEAAPAETLSDNSASAEASDSAAGEKADVELQSILEEPIRDSTQSGAKTQYDLYLGEIGYVDVDSILQDRDPYSIVALLQQHRAQTGARELLELEIESTGGTHWGHNANFVQVIGGTPTEARGSVSFDASGAVYTISGSLFETQAAGTGNVVILQAEAEAIAREAAVRFVEPRRAPFAERGKPLRIDALSVEMRYAVDPKAGNSLRAEWRVVVSTFNPTDDVEVLVSAKEGQIVGMQSLIQRVNAQSACSELTFRVCDGNSAVKWSCSPLSGTTRVFDDGECVAVEAENWRCEDSKYTTPKDVADDARDYVNSIGSKYLKGLGGTDGQIDILINVDHDEFSGNAMGLWRSSDQAILIRKPFPHSESGRWIYPAEEISTTAHELFHGATVGIGKVEHGLVYSMDALYEDKYGRSDTEWDGPDGSLTTPQKIYKGDTLEVVGNTMYRIYRKVGAGKRDEVFRFALEVDQRRATSLVGFREALTTVVRDFPESFQRAVAEVLVAMGINDAVAGTVSITMLRFIEAKMRAIFAMNPDDDTIGAAAAEAMRRIREYFGIQDDQPMRSHT